MKKPASKFTLAILLAVLLLSACQPAAPTALPDLTIPAPTLEFTEFPKAALAARSALAGQLNLTDDEVTIEQVIPALWADSCLGLGGADESCLQVITSGYLVTLSAGGQVYEYRTDMEGRVLRPVPGGMEKPFAVDATIQTLAQQLDTDPALITLIAFEPVDWPDSCLGVETPGIMCAEVITPGYRVLLSANGNVYEFHTNQDGSQVAAASLTAAQSDAPVIILKTIDPQQGCHEIQVSSSGIATGKCGGILEFQAFPGMQRSVELEVWMARYAPFEVSAEDGSMIFNGRGFQTVIVEEQRALIAWTRLVELEIEEPPEDPPPGLVIDWHRTGGLAGVCDHLMIFESGFVYARDCEQNALGQTLLQTEQIKLLYNWRDTLAPAKFTAKDGVTDGFQYEILFNGAGKQAPDDSEQQDMLILSAQLFDILVP